MFPKNSAIFKACHFEVADVVSGHLASILLIFQDVLAGFLKTLLSNGPFASNNFFAAKSSSILKIKRETIAFSHLLQISLGWFSKNRLDIQEARMDKVEDETCKPNTQCFKVHFRSL